MTNKILSHPSLVYAQDFSTICEPLRHLNINYFSHANINQNNEFSVHCSHPQFLEYYLNKKYYNSDIISAKSKSLGKYIVWDDLTLDGETDKMNREGIEYGVDHTFSIIEQSESGTDFYQFSSNLIGDAINQEYIRNIDLLHRFIHYFKETIKTSKSLNKAYDIKFTFDDCNEGFKVINKNNQYQHNIEQFLNDIKFSSNSTLSMRQLECLSLYTKGKTAREISIILGLSIRTVQNYISIVKDKLGIFSKVELAMFMLKNDI